MKPGTIRSDQGDDRRDGDSDGGGVRQRNVTREEFDVPGCQFRSLGDGGGSHADGSQFTDDEHRLHGTNGNLAHPRVPKARADESLRSSPL